MAAWPMPSGLFLPLMVAIFCRGEGHCMVKGYVDCIHQHFHSNRGAGVKGAEAMAGVEADGPLPPFLCQVPSANTTIANLLIRRRVASGIRQS